MRNRLLLTRRGTEKSINIMASYAQGDEQDCVSCFHSTKYVCLCCKMPVCNKYASLKVTKKQMDGLSAKVSDIVVLATSNIKAAKPRNQREKTQPKTPEGMC